MLSRRSLLNMDNKKIILVDHNEKGQAVDGIDEAEILEIIDHHRLGSMETALPVFFRNQPVGCTGTIIYDLYQENNVEVDKKIAGLLCSAIISDTLMFRSPTCTPKDKKAAEELAKIADIEIQEHAEKMFRAGSSLADKTPKNSAVTIKTLAQGRFLPWIRQSWSSCVLKLRLIWKAQSRKGKCCSSC